MGLDFVRREIERMRLQIRRQRKEIQALARAGIATVAAEALLARMLDNVDGLVVERARLVGEARRLPVKVLKGTPDSRRV